MRYFTLGCESLIGGLKQFTPASLTQSQAPLGAARHLPSGHGTLQPVVSQDSAEASYHSRGNPFLGAQYVPNPHGHGVSYVTYVKGKGDGFSTYTKSPPTFDPLIYTNCTVVLFSCLVCTPSTDEAWIADMPLGLTMHAL